MRKLKILTSMLVSTLCASVCLIGITDSPARAESPGPDIQDQNSQNQSTGSLATDGQTVTSSDVTLTDFPVSETSGVTTRQVRDTGSAKGSDILASLTKDSTEPFNMFGLKWGSISAPTPVFQVEVLQSGTWVELEEVAVEELQDTGSDAFFVGESTGIRVKAVSAGAGSSVENLEVSLINSPLSETNAAPVAMRMNLLSSSSSQNRFVPKPKIISRENWGADESMIPATGCKPEYASQMKGVVVHHTAGSNTYSASQSPAILRGTMAWHIKGRGWCDVGYNFLVDMYGNIYEGRHGGIDRLVVGAHARGSNTGTVGVAVMMNSDEADLSDAALNAMTDLIAWKMANSYLPDAHDTTLVGGKTQNVIMMHKDVNATSCPGTHITARMDEIRDLVAQKMAGRTSTPIYLAWQNAGGADSYLGSATYVEDNYLSGRITRFKNGYGYMSPDGVSTVFGAVIASKYEALGGPESSLGWPTKSQVSKSGSGSAATVSVEFNYGTISHNPKTGYQVSYRNQTSNPITGQKSAVWGDYDADGLSDTIAIDSKENGLWIMPNEGNLAIGSAHRIGYNWHDFHTLLSTPDINSDGNADLLALRDDHTWWLYPGTGTGRVDSAHRLGHGWDNFRQYAIVEAGDTGQMPFLFAIHRNGKMYRYSFTSTSYFSNATVVGHGWDQIQDIMSVGDFTNNGTPDLLARTKDGRLLAYELTTDGRFTGATRQVGHGWDTMSRPYVGEVDGDGRLDLLSRASDGTLRAYRHLKTSFGASTIVGRNMNGYRVLA